MDLYLCVYGCMNVCSLVRAYEADHGCVCTYEAVRGCVLYVCMWRCVWLCMSHNVFGHVLCKWEKYAPMLVSMSECNVCTFEVDVEISYAVW